MDKSAFYRSDINCGAIDSLKLAQLAWFNCAQITTTVPLGLRIVSELPQLIQTVINITNHPSVRVESNSYDYQSHITTSLSTTSSKVHDVIIMKVIKEQKPSNRELVSKKL